MIKKILKWAVIHSAGGRHRCRSLLCVKVWTHTSHLNAQSYISYFHISRPE